MRIRKMENSQIVAQHIRMTTEKPNVSALPIRVFYLLQLQRLEKPGIYTEPKSRYTFEVEEGQVGYVMYARGQIADVFHEYISGCDTLSLYEFIELQDLAVDQCSEMFEKMGKEQLMDFIAGRVSASSSYIMMIDKEEDPRG